MAIPPFIARHRLPGTTIKQTGNYYALQRVKCVWDKVAKKRRVIVIEYIGRVTEDGIIPKTKRLVPVAETPKPAAGPSENKTVQAHADAPAANPATATPVPEILGRIPDPRVERTKAHSIGLLLFVALCATLCGGRGFNAMQTYARARQGWLRKHLGMTGVPSHDTFNRLFQCLDRERFAQCLSEVARAMRKKAFGEVVAFDGKTHRRTGKAGGGAFHMLNAWAADNRLVLGQQAVEEKSNEITAMPLLMERLDIKGCVVTADALNTQKAVAAKAVEKGADYVLALKENHPLMHAEVTAFMDALSRSTQPGFEQVEKDHGRLERRRCWQTRDVGWFADRKHWAGLRSFILVESECEGGGRSERTRRYFISSLPLDAQRAAGCVRAHWEVENALHWRLDVVFSEDQSRARTRHAAHNLGTLRALSLNLVGHMEGKESTGSKMFQMALNPESMLQTLAKI